MTGDPVASRRRMVSWTADSYSALSSGCEIRPAWKPWTPSINAAGLGMLPMGSVGSITMRLWPRTRPLVKDQMALPLPVRDHAAAARHHPTCDPDLGDLALGTRASSRIARDRPAVSL